MFVLNSALFREIAIGTVVVVVCMLLAAMTLLPALLSLLGSHINRGALPRRLRPADSLPQIQGAGEGNWARWALLVMRKPVLAVTVTVLVLLALAIPVLRLHSGFDAGVLRDPSTVSGKAEKLLAQSISPGVSAPVQIVLTGRDGKGNTRSYEAAAKSLSATLESDSRVTGVIEYRRKGGVLVTVVPSVPIDSPTANTLVRHIRSDLAPPLEAHGHLAVYVGGPTAQALDQIAELNAKRLSSWP